jgi:hypothetical protein
MLANFEPDNIRSAARSSGDAFFFTSCTILMAVSRSTAWPSETRETFEPARLLSFVAEPRVLPKQDSEFVLESPDTGRCKLTTSSGTSSSPFGELVCLKLLSTGESSCDLTCCRSLALRWAYREDKEDGESTTLGASGGEFVFVLGFDSRLWGWWLMPLALCALPILSKSSLDYEQKAP